MRASFTSGDESEPTAGSGVSAQLHDDDARVGVGYTGLPYVSHLNQRGRGFSWMVRAEIRGLEHLLGG